jgi:hypothetical protein
MLDEILTSDIDRETKILWCELFPFQHLLSLPTLKMMEQMSKSDRISKLRRERNALKALKIDLR